MKHSRQIPHIQMCLLLNGTSGIQNNSNYRLAPLQTPAIATFSKSHWSGRTYPCPTLSFHYTSYPGQLNGTRTAPTGLRLLHMGHILPASPSCLTYRLAQPCAGGKKAYFGRKTTFAACQFLILRGQGSLQMIGIHTDMSVACPCTFLWAYCLIKYMCDGIAV